MHILTPFYIFTHLSQKTDGDNGGQTLGAILIMLIFMLFEKSKIWKGSERKRFKVLLRYVIFF